MKDLKELRNKMAEKGMEFTPRQFEGMIKALRRCQRGLKKRPDTLSELTIYEKQGLMRELAEDGKEVTMAELDEIIDIATTIRNMADI